MSGRCFVRSCELVAGRVVLVDRADALEQLGTVRVVEQPARQPFRPRTQAVENVVAHERAAGLHGNAGTFAHHVMSLATRAPVICQRAAGGKKLRYVARM